MVCFYTRAEERRSCETRLAADGPGYELVVQDAVTQVEKFSDLGKLLAREHELLTAWRAQGWRTVVGSGEGRSGRVGLRVAAR